MTPDTSASFRKTRNCVLPLIAILAAGAALRLFHITQPLDDLFSWREASTAMMADNFWLRNGSIFYPEVSWVGPGPGYQGREFQIFTYICSLLYRALGWHDWIGRTLAVACGVMTILAFHRLVDRLSGQRMANMSALMLALMPGAIFIQRSFLPGPGMLALIACGAWLFVAYLQTDRLWLLLAATVLTTLGILAKPPAITAIPPIAYAAVTILKNEGRLDRKHVVLLCGAASFCVATLASYGLWAHYLGSRFPPYHIAGFGYIWQVPLLFIRAGFFLKNAFTQTVDWILAPPLLLLAGVGLLSPLRDPGKRAGASPAPWFFHVWLMSAVLLYLIAGLELSANPWNFLIYVVPAAFFAARGLILILDAWAGAAPERWAWARLAFVTFIILASDADVLSRVEAPAARTGYELGRRLNMLSAPGDLVITAPSRIGDPVAAYYSRRHGWLFPPGGRLPPGGPLANANWAILEPDSDAIERLEALRSRGAAWFGIAKDAHDSWDRRLLDFNAGVIDHLNQTAERVEDNERFVIYRLARPEEQRTTSAEEPAPAGQARISDSTP